MRRAYLVIGLLRLLAYLPLPLLHALGNGMGLLLYLMPNRTRSVARTNLALCLPEYPPTQRQHLLRQTLSESAKTFMELPALWQWSCVDTLRLVRSVHGEAYLHQAMQRRKGVILLTPHLGAWELSGLYVSAHYAITSLYRPPQMHDLDTFVRHCRERCGAHLVPTDAGGIRALIQTLRRGEIAGILPDQDPGQRGLGDFAPFFGVPAYTMLLVSRLAMKTGAPVILVHAERLAWGKGFDLHFRSVSEQIYAPTPNISLSVLNQSIEECVRQALAQYQWGYKRFKTRPVGSPSVYE